LGLNSMLHSRGMSAGYEIALFNANGGYDGYSGDHFLICPPFIVTKADVDDIVERTARVVEDTFAELVNSAVWEKVTLQMEIDNSREVKALDAAPAVGVAVGVAAQ
jgi:hypothetical protein